MLFGGGALALGFSHCANAAISIMEPEIPPQGRLVDRALRALDLHRGSFVSRDIIGIADFTEPSSAPRFYILDVDSGRSRALLVAHGRGSDPDHSGWVERFSNSPGSAASSAGAYVTGDAYYGRHGLSRRLIGLDPENCNAEARAIVIHAAPGDPVLAHEVGDPMLPDRDTCGWLPPRCAPQPFVRRSSQVPRCSSTKRHRIPQIPR